MKCSLIFSSFPGKHTFSTYNIASDSSVLYCLFLLQATKTPGLRSMTKADVPAIHSLLQANTSKFDLSAILSLEEIEHWLLPRDNLIDSYVVQVCNNVPPAYAKREWKAYWHIPPLFTERWWSTDGRAEFLQRLVQSSQSPFAHSSERGSPFVLCVHFHRPSGFHGGHTGPG